MGMIKPKKYKIIPCNYVKEMYQIKVWRWYWPFWERVGFHISFESIEEAKEYLNKLKNAVYY